MGLGKAVQEEERWSRSSPPQKDGSLAGVDLGGGEVIHEGGPGSRRWRLGVSDSTIDACTPGSVARDDRPGRRGGSFGRVAHSVYARSSRAQGSAGSPWSLATPSNLTPARDSLPGRDRWSTSKGQPMTRVALALVALLAGAGPALGQSSTAPTSAV